MPSMTTELDSYVVCFFFQYYFSLPQKSSLYLADFAHSGMVLEKQQCDFVQKESIVCI